jgi:hypothetical protein
MLRERIDEQLMKLTKLNEANQERDSQMRKDVSEQRVIVNDLRLAVDKRLTADEGKMIWANFQKFAVYSDLTDLYNKCLPSISSFEDKIYEYHSELIKTNQMMRRMDEVLSMKCNRTELKDFQQEAKYLYCTKDENLHQFDGFLKESFEMKDKFGNMEAMVQNLVKQL